MDVIPIVAASLSCIASGLSIYAALKAKSNEAKIDLLDQHLEQVNRSEVQGGQRVTGNGNLQVGGNVNAK